MLLSIVKVQCLIEVGCGHPSFMPLARYLTTSLTGRRAHAVPQDYRWLQGVDIFFDIYLKHLALYSMLCPKLGTLTSHLWRSKNLTSVALLIDLSLLCGLGRL